MGPNGEVTPEEAFGVPAGHRIPVADKHDPSQRGFVDWSTFNGGGVQPESGLSPIYNAAGAVIAYWGSGAGWLTKQEVAAPGFNLKALAAAAEAHGQAVANQLGYPGAVTMTTQP